MRPPPANFDRSVPALLFKVGQYPIHHGGVGAIRTLGRVGVPVYAVTEDAATPAAASRYLEGYFVFSTTGAEDEEELVAGLASIGRRVGRRSVLACTDDEAAVLVAAHASELVEWFITPGVAAALPGRLASKRGVFELCRELGTPTPDAQFPVTLGELEEFAAPRDVPGRGEEPRGLHPDAPAGRWGQHDRRVTRGSARARLKLARAVQRDRPRVHPRRGRRGLDLPGLLRRGLGTAGRVHRRQAAIVAGERRSDDVRAGRGEPAARRAGDRLLSPCRLPGNRRPRLAARPP